MIEVIHTADIHFGVENYGRIDPETGIHSRLLDFERALNTCIDYAIEKDVDLFLFSGDAYKTAHPTPTQQKLLVRCLLRLHAKKIPVVIVIGNHDNPLSFGKANSLEIFKDLPFDTFYVIDKPKLLKIDTKRGPIQIVGIPWPTRNTISLNTKHMQSSTADIISYISDAVTAIIADFAQKCDPTIPAILAGHLTVSTGIFSGSEKRAIYGDDPVFLPSQLALPPFDYVALGHLHRYQNLNPHAYPAIIYSGSIERIDFGERKEEKGFCHVHLERHTTTHTFVEVPTRPFIQIEVYLDGEKDQTDQIKQKIESYKLTDAIVKILYHVPAEQRDTVDIAAIERACKHAHFIVGIIPIRKQDVRQKRSATKIEMDLKHLLGSYFESKQELQQEKNILIEKALALHMQAHSKEDQE